MATDGRSLGCFGALGLLLAAGWIFNQGSKLSSDLAFSSNVNNQPEALRELCDVVQTSRTQYFELKRQLEGEQNSLRADAIREAMTARWMARNAAAAALLARDASFNWPVEIVSIDETWGDFYIVLDLRCPIKVTLRASVEDTVEWRSHLKSIQAGAAGRIGFAPKMDENGLAEGSLTEAGSMDEPAFKIDLTSIAND